MTLTDQFGAFTTQDVTITVNGTNDIPVLTINDTEGAVTEDDDEPSLSDSGALSFTDVDNGDNHTISFAHVGSVIWSGGNLTQGQIDDFIAGFSADSDSWDYTVLNSLTQFLSEGETISLSFEVTVTDSFGATDTETVNITINGDNDTPVITVNEGEDSGSVKEAGVIDDFDQDPGNNNTPAVAVLEANGTLVGSDADDNAVITWSGNASGVYGEFTIDNNGNWTYTLNDSALVDALASGESHLEVFTVTLTDQFGAFTTQDVTITVNGTNDIPVLTINDTEGAVTEDDDEPSLSDSGALSFTDVDNGDNHTISFAHVGSVIWSGGNLTQGQIDDFIAGFSADSDSWDYTVLNSLTQFLSEGETISLSFEVTVTDSFGATDTETVNITINGDNDTPVISNITSVTVSEEGLDSGIIDNVGVPTDTTNLKVNSGLITFTDADADAQDSSIFDVTLSGPTTDMFSDGQLISWSWNNASKTLTGSVGQNTIMSIALGTVTSNLTGFEVGYTVTLFDSIDHPLNSIEDILTFAFGVTINDGVQDVNANFNVTVEDDAPVDEVDENLVHNIPHLIGESVIADLFDPGADGFGSINFNVLTNGLQYNGVALEYTMSGSTLTASANGVDVFTLTAVLDGNGHYDYQFTLLQQIDLETIIDYDIDSAPAGNNTTYFVDSDGAIYAQNGQASNVISTITGYTNGISSQINSNSHGIGVGPQTSIANNESIIIDYGVNGTNLLAINLGTNNNGNHSGSADIQYIVTYSDNSTKIVNTTIGPTLLIEELEFNGLSIMSIEIVHVSGEDFQITGLASNGLVFNAPIDIAFGYAATDGDGDAVVFAGANTGEFSVTLTPDNYVPNALNNFYQVDYEGLVAGNVITDDTGSGVDSDSNNDPLLLTQVNGIDLNFIGGEAEVILQGGLLTIQEDGSYTFEHDGNSSTPINFSYTINDGNGGTDTANVSIAVYDSETLNPGDDNYIGTDGNDTIISDTPDILAGADYNLAFLIDSSGSMGDSAVATAKAQILSVLATLITNANQPSAGTVNVLLVDFDQTAKILIAIDLSSNDPLASITTALEAMSSGGTTNYSAAFTAAYNWFNDNYPQGNNRTFFITDGEPNTDNGQPGDYFENAQNAFALLNALSYVEAIGLGGNVNSSTLQQFDTEAPIINNVDVDDLADAILGSNILPGNDTINAGEGDDIIFGDLTDFFGNSMQGMDAIRQYVADELSVNVATVTDAEVHNFISQNIEDFDVSQIDDGGDTLNGANGNDILFGQGGMDILNGGAGNDIIMGGDDNDTISGGSGRDLLSGGKGDDSLYGGTIASADDSERDFFWWSEDSADNSTDTVYGFNQQIDVLDLSDLLINEENGNLEDYFSSITISGGDTTIVLDIDGVAGGDGVTIVLDGIDLSLVYGSNNESDIIAGLIADDALIVDPNSTFIPPYEQIDQGNIIP
ncbi:beta strand repeat-containing protein [Shewanella piezotolerans]|uniref:beta strand repeat-containing protein n=1 Tax=Shewanella piezotolerans TaxID=404011 RepID=UPI0005C91195|nr:VCBS domain-containing protein [Shewanella piezotolerans]